MLKSCLNCGVEFEGASQARFHSDACRKAYARRELGRMDGREPGQSRTGEEVGQALSAHQEQLIRDAFGYAASESRSKAERDATARRITGKVSLPLTEEEYVRRTVAEALAYSVSIGETDAPVKIGDYEHTNRRTDRLRRAGAYARWRWAGFHAGEIASL